MSTNVTNFYENAIETSHYGNGDMTIVVPDQALENTPVIMNQIHINYMKFTEDYEKICKSEFSRCGYHEDYLHTKIEVLEMSRITAMVIAIAYLSIYIGIVFLIMSAVILAIAQLSEASDNISRYGLLQKIGAEDRMINRALFVQILIYFAVPLFLSVIHSWIGMMVIGDASNISIGVDIFGNSAFVFIVFFSIYGGYFLATYLGSNTNPC